MGLGYWTGLHHLASWAKTSFGRCKIRYKAAATAAAEVEMKTKDLVMSWLVSRPTYCSIATPIFWPEFLLQKKRKKENNKKSPWVFLPLTRKIVCPIFRPPASNAVPFPCCLLNLNFVFYFLKCRNWMIFVVLTSMLMMRGNACRVSEPPSMARPRRVDVLRTTTSATSWSLLQAPAAAAIPLRCNNWWCSGFTY